MSDRIIGLHDWFETPPGHYLLDWERGQYDQAVADIFGYHALQLGLPALDALQANRMSHRWLAVNAAAEPVQDARRPALLADFAALPFPAASLDLVLLPHALETHADPHAVLREVERVLVPEGRVVITGFNPASLWGLRRQRESWCQRFGLGEATLPTLGESIAYWRMRDWLRLLSFEVEAGHHGCYRPAVHSEKWLRRFEWMDRVGSRWWPILGAVYFLVAVKRVHGMRLLEPSWKTLPSRASAPVSIANRSGDNPVRAAHGPSSSGIGQAIEPH